MKKNEKKSTYTEAQKRAIYAYRKRNKEKVNYTNLKSNAKAFIGIGDMEELEEMKTMIDEQISKMKRKEATKQFMNNNGLKLGEGFTLNDSKGLELKPIVYYFEEHESGDIGLVTYNHTWVMDETHDAVISGNYTVTSVPLLSTWELEILRSAPEEMSLLERTVDGKLQYTSTTGMLEMFGKETERLLYDDKPVDDLFKMIENGDSINVKQTLAYYEK